MTFVQRCRLVAFAAIASFASAAAQADSVPELLHYRFDGTGTSVPNLASSPPAGTETATLMGSLTQTGTDLNTGGGGFSLLGNGLSSSSEYLNTGWATALPSASWTISFVSSNIPSTTSTFYIFGDINANQFRCFTGGVAGAGNWILRGNGVTDVPVPGGAAAATRRTTFVYDSTTNQIRAYLDGVLVSTVAQTGALALSGTGPFKVGGYSTSASLPANGLLDDFRLYNRALTAVEVADIDVRPAAEVIGNALTIDDGDTTPDATDDTDFGNTNLGSSVTHTFSILNDGNQDLVIDSVTFSGANPEDFSVTAAPTSPVPAGGGGTTFDVTFTPGVAGARAATLNIATNDPLATTYDFAIQGNGLAPEIAVSGNAVDIASGDLVPDAADFTDFVGAAVAGDTVVRSFVVANTGNADLLIDSVTLGGANPEDFSVTIAPASPVAAASDTTLQITFDPSVPGLRSATVTLANNDSDENPFVFAVQGVGLAPEIAVSGNGTDIANGDATPDAADATDFGALAVSGGTAVHTFTIENPGNADLTILQVLLGGSEAQDFSISTMPATTVTAGGSTTLEVTFDPGATGLRSVVVTIDNGDADENPFTFSLQGTGMVADVQASKTNFEDGAYPGRDTVYTIQVLNAGPAPVSGVQVVDDVADAQFADAQWTCDSTPAGLCPNASGGPDINETTGALPNGALLEYTLVATPTATSGTVSNTVVATNLDGDDPIPDNNTATDEDPVLPDTIFSDGFEDAGNSLLRAPISR